MSGGRPKQPRALAPLPVRLAVIDERGRFRALVENYADAVTVFAQLNLDKPLPPDEVERHLMTSGWSVEKLTKPLHPQTDGRNLLWDLDAMPSDQPTPSGEDNGFVIWLRS
jgi:hypothetical protein